MEPQINQSESVIAPLKKVTPLSKYLAMALFIILPFLGGWIGYTYAPEKIVEVERSFVTENTPKRIQQNEEVQKNNQNEKVQLSNTYTNESFLAAKDEKLGFISTSKSCEEYMGGEDCTIVVSANDYGLVPGTLERKTGPFEWHPSDSLVEVRVMENGKLFLVWGFGDGGASSRVFSVWDTKEGKHTLTSSYGGMMRELMSVAVNISGTEKTFVVLAAGDSPYVPEGSINVFDRDMFDYVNTDPVGARPDYCIDVNPIPKDRTNPASPWLLEYTYGCDEIGENIASRFYELDPVSGQLKQL